MTRWWRRFAIGAAAVLVCTPKGGAAAQTASAPGPDAALQEVVVTAEGRLQRSFDVAAALTPFTPVDLERLRPETLADLSAYTPGLYIDTQFPSTPTITIRGVGIDSPDVTSEPRVSIFQDGVYYSRPQSALFELFDEQRVEILKGPQTTLFGRSALAGAIDVVQTKPQLDAFSAAARAEGGDFGHHLEEGELNLPLGDRAAVRLAYIDRATDGYVDNLAGGPALNGVAVDAGRLSFRAQANGVTADLILNAQHDRYTSPSDKSGVFAPDDPSTGRPLGDRDPYKDAYLATAPGFQLGGQGGSRTLQGATLVLKAPVAGSLSLLSTSAYTRFHTRIVGDYDGSSLSLATSGEDEVDRQLSQDLRLAYEPAGPLKAYVGGSYADERGRQFVPVVLNEPEALGLKTGVIDRTDPTLAPEGVYINPQTVAAELQGAAAYAGYAMSPALAAALAANLSTAHAEALRRADTNRYGDLYADAVLDLGRRIELDAGVRYSWVDKRTTLATFEPARSVLAGVFAALTQPAPVRDGLLAALAAPGASTIPPSAAYPVPLFGLFDQPTASTSGDAARLSDQGPSGRLSLRYQVSRQANVYASYAHGRLPAVLTAEAPAAPGGAALFQPLAPETLDSVDGGGKARLFQGHLELAADIYALWYQHFDTVVLQNTSLVDTDAGRAAAYGAEASVRLRATTWADLIGAYGYDHARFGSGLYRGNHFRFAPDNTLSIQADLHRDLGPGVISLTPQYTWRSKVYFDDTNGDLALASNAFLTPPPYRAYQSGLSLVNARLGYGPADRRWRAELYVRNLFDARYLRDIEAGSLNLGLPSYIAAPPRMFGASVSARLGA